jgi:hypothetical protein
VSGIENVFEQFYDTNVEVYRLTKSSAYSAEAETELVCMVAADIQPYDGGLTDMDFGAETVKRFKLYCAPNDNIREGGYVKAGDMLCRIIYVERRATGIMAVVRCEVEQNA